MVLAAALLFTPIASGAAGDLDPTFGNGGKVVTDFGAYEFANGMAIQPDGKIVVVGDDHASSTEFIRDFVLARYQSDGSLDPSFSGGRVRTDFDGSSDSAADVEVQGDGKLVVGGLAWVGPHPQFGVARYNQDGTLDPTFGSGGKAAALVGSDGSGASALALQPDGRIVMAGYASTQADPRTTDVFALARFNPDGSLDSSFDADGKVVTDFTTGPDLASALEVQSDGKILVAGITDASSGGGGLALARYNADGSLDSSFDGDGKVTAELPPSPFFPQLAIQPDGKILVSAGVLLRYLPDGSLDSTFASSGRTGFVAAGPLALEPDGRIIVAEYPGTRAFVVTRYRSDGTPADDLSGSASFGQFQHTSDLAVQQDRKIVVAGYTGDNERMDFALVRFLNPLPRTARKCRVPDVRGKTVRAARTRLTRAHCALGRLRRTASRKVKKGRVISQSPRPGRALAARAKVNVVVSRGRKR
jgi:uncharacterized delta-60 repeat protein